MNHRPNIHRLAIALVLFSLAALIIACGSDSNATVGEGFCADGTDNDLDGRVDCDDPDCARAPVCTTEHCYNLIDDDEDGDTDCDDDECQGASVCLALGEHCVSGEDDDRDGDTDCNDADCAQTAACIPDGEDCVNGVDDDGDGDIDCEDTDCAKTAVCLPRAEHCTNGADDDEDGSTDCNDSDCARTRDCLDSGEDCSNGVDDDGDAAIDCGDGDCAQTATCLPLGEGCTNGVDDDGDGDIDCNDDDCASSPDCISPPEYCTNGFDDDGDGDTDCDDADCELRAPCLLRAEVCDDGIDDNGDGDVDCDDETCADFSGCREAGFCNNEIDDDDDGDIDCADSECADAPSCQAGPDVIVNVFASGSGSVRDLNGEIDCPGDCQMVVPAGTKVELVAIGDVGHNLFAWDGCDSVDDNICTVNPQSDVTLSATFSTVGDYQPPDISGCPGADAGVTVLDEARLDDLGPGEVSSESSGFVSATDPVTHPTDGLDESLMHFNVFQDVPFEASHVCFQLANISLSMESQGSYVFYLATGPFGGPQPPMTTIARQVIATPQDAGMQLVSLDTPYGPESNVNTWAGLAFPKDNGLDEMATAASVAPGIADDAYLATVEAVDSNIMYFDQFQWTPYDSTGDIGFVDRQPVIRLLRAVDPSQVTSFALEIEVNGSGDVSTADSNISCPGACADSYPLLQQVVLEAQPESGLSVTWTGCDVELGPFCVVRMNDDRAVSATFN
jgi:hypothetical protein